MKGKGAEPGVLLDPATQAQRLAWVKTESPQIQYGLGIANLNGLIGHNGEISGYNSQSTRRQVVRVVA